MAESDTADRLFGSGDDRLAQLAAEWHPEAFAAELPESWAGHDADMVFTQALRTEA